MLEWLQNVDLRRRVHAGLNKGEARNALARAVFFNRLGEMRDRSFENQRYRASGLNLVTAAIVLWNTVYLDRAIKALINQGQSVDENLLQHLSPLGWEHINLTGIMSGGRTNGARKANIDHSDRSQRLNVQLIPFSTVTPTMGRRGFGYVLALTVVVTLVGAAGMFAFEGDLSDGSGLKNYSAALWWTVMLMTTSGSEYWPQTAEGRVLCFLLALYAFAVFGYVTATVATFFIGRDAENEEAELASAQSIADLHREIQALREEVRALSLPEGG